MFLVLCLSPPSTSNPLLQSPTTDEQDLFCSVYDLSKRISPSKLEKAKRNGNLDFISIDDSESHRRNDRDSKDSDDSDMREIRNGLDDEDQAWENERRKSRQKGKANEIDLEEINSFDLAFEKIRKIVDEALEKAKQRR